MFSFFCFTLFIIPMTDLLAQKTVKNESKINEKIKSLKTVSEIRYVGLGAISASDVEKNIPIRVGDYYSDGLKLNLLDPLKIYYAGRGYRNAKIDLQVKDIEGSNVILIIKVDEGEPCLITSVGISDPPMAGGIAVSRKFKESIYKAFLIKPGDRYDEDHIYDRVRVLREYLIKNNFIQASLEKLNVNFSDGGNKASIDLSMKYGDRVTFGFIGNKVFSHGQLYELILQLKNTDMGKDYEEVIRRKIEDEYKALAYNDVIIRSYYSRDGVKLHLTYDIKENQRSHIGEVKIEGINPASINAARTSFYEGSSRLVQRGYYVEKDVDRGAQALVEYLKSRGYLSARMASKTVKRDTRTGKYNITLQFIEGEQTIINSITVSGNAHYSQEQIESFLDIKQGIPFNPYSFEQLLQDLRRRYKDEGYLESQVSQNAENIVKFSDKNRKIAIVIEINEGTRFKVGDIRIDGLTKTKTYVVSREIEFKKDDWWLAPRVYDLEDSLKRLGVFAEVRVLPVPSALGAEYRDMVIEVREGEPGVLEFGPGFRSDLGGRAFARLSYNNLFGRNQIVTLSGDANRRIGGVFPYRFIEYGLQATATDPRLFSSRNALTLGLNTSRRQFIDFNAVQTQLFASVDRKLYWPQLLGKLTYKVERIRQFDAPFIDDNQTLLIGSVAPMLVLDQRDNPFTATRGHMTNFTFEYAWPSLAGKSISDSDAVHYYKWSATSHFYVPIPKGIVWSNVVGGGFAKNLTGYNNIIPLIKTFRLGGYASVRGFREDSINKDRSRITGTLSYLNLRTQMDIPLAGELRIAPFLDAGNVYLDKLSEMPFFRVGAGAGLHYMTPIGPINFDYGINLNRRGSESGGLFHFSVGII
jgi:outer membrane protein insertion porin family